MRSVASSTTRFPRSILNSQTPGSSLPADVMTWRGAWDLSRQKPGVGRPNGAAYDFPPPSFGVRAWRRLPSLEVGPAALDSIEQKKNNVYSLFQPEEVMVFRAVVEEAAALASISLFIAMLAVWIQVFSVI